MKTFTLTLWRTFARGRRTQYTWLEFVDTFVADPEIVRDKKRVAGYSLATFEGNRRALARVEQVFGLVLDLDYGRPTVEAFVRAFPKTLGTVYTTWSHEPHAPRLRAAFLYSRPVSAQEHERIWIWGRRKCEAVGLELDVTTRDASHLFFLPSHRPGAEYRFKKLRGRPIDVDKVLAQKWLRELAADELRRGAHTPAAVTCGGPLQGTATGGDRSVSGRDWDLCLRLMRAGKTDDEIADELRRTSPKFWAKGPPLSNRYGDLYVDLTVARARERHEAHAPLMRVQRAALHCLPPRFAYPERRHIDLELMSADGEIANAQIVVPAPWHSDAARVTWAACFPDLEADVLLGPWADTKEVWRRLRWKHRAFEVAVRGGEVRWIRASGIPVDTCRPNVRPSLNE